MSATELERNPTLRRFEVTFHNHRIYTLVTYSPDMVDFWIICTEGVHSRRLHKLIVGFDIQWRPNNGNARHTNPVATLQLCVGRRCLIYQLLHAPVIPSSLVRFLVDVDYTFVGVGIQAKKEKLFNDYGLRVRNVVNLAELAARVSRLTELRNADLSRLARAILGMEIRRPEHVAGSWWDHFFLSNAQVHYACVDAFVSFEIGRRLHASASYGVWMMN